MEKKQKVKSEEIKSMMKQLNEGKQKIKEFRENVQKCKETEGECSARELKKLLKKGGEIIKLG